MVDAVTAAAGPVEGLAVLEVGCGTGNVLARLRAGRPARLTGIDMSRQMLAEARRKLGPGSGTPDVDLHQGDAVEQLRRTDAASIDVVVISNVLYALPDRAAFWAEAERVLAPGGRIALSNPDRAGFSPAIRQQWRERRISGFTDARLAAVILLNVAIDMIASTRRYSFQSWEELTAEARSAGLARSELTARCYGGPTEGMNVVGVLARE
jgi:ubiquinone/menaquinone biosynthesis C-methylase UbiE